MYAYLNKNVKLPKQLDYANKYEFDEGEVVVRNMETSEQEKMKIGDLVNYFKVEQMNS